MLCWSPLVFRNSENHETCSFYCSQFAYVFTVLRPTWLVSYNFISKFHSRPKRWRANTKNLHFVGQILCWSWISNCLGCISKTCWFGFGYQLLFVLFVILSGSVQVTKFETEGISNKVTNQETRKEAKDVGNALSACGWLIRFVELLRYSHVLLPRNARPWERQLCYLHRVFRTPLPVAEG